MALPQSNKTVLLGGAVIITVGFAKSVTSGGSPTKVFAGGVGVVLLASLLELAGDTASAIASGLVGIATITVLLVEAPAVFKAISQGQKNAHNPFSGAAQAQNAGSTGQPTGSPQTGTRHPTTKGVGGPSPVP